MTQILIEVGAASWRPIRDAIMRALADTAISTEVLSTSDCHDLHYRASELDIDTLFSELESGRLCSIRLRSDSARIAWALVFGPTFDTNRGAPWTAAIELRNRDFNVIFDQLLSVPGLTYVVVSQEETLDLTPEQAKDPSFPWDDWRLIRAALVSESKVGQRWLVRDGPAKP